MEDETPSPWARTRAVIAEEVAEAVEMIGPLISIAAFVGFILILSWLFGLLAR
jgi:hypothetical protein